MPYGIIKVDNITFDNGGADQNVTVSGIHRAITSGVTVTGTISGAVLIGTTTVSGATVTGTIVQGTTVQGVSGTFTSLTGTTTTGTTANFVSGVFTTLVSGTTITGNTGQFTSGTFVSLTGTTITGTTVNAVTVSSTTGTFGSITGTTITGTTINGVTVNATTGNFTSLIGVTVTGTTAQFVSGVFTTQVSGLTVTGTQSSFTSGNFITLSGATATFTSGVIASGTAAAPSLSILGDPNTGIYSPGADQVAVATNGAQRLLIDSSGQIESAGLGTAAAPAWSFVSDPNTGIYSPGADQLAISTGGSERFLIGSTGSILSQGGPWNFSRYGGASANLVVNGFDGTQAAPTAVATSRSIGGVQGTAYDGTAGRQIGGISLWAETAPTSTSSPGFISFTTTPSGSTTPTERLRITSAGLVGIGTSAPWSLATINDQGTAGDITSARQLSVGSSSGYSVSFGYYQTGVAQPFAGAIQALDGGAGTRLLLNPSGGNVGIGTTSPGATLHLYDATAPSFRLGQASVTYNSYVDSGNYVCGTITNHPFVFTTNNTERARITSSGRLLVGTSTALDASPVQVRNDSGSSLSMVRSSADGFGPTINIYKSRGTAGSPAEVNNGDNLGFINFSGYDGAGYSVAANIEAQADGTWTDGGDTTDNPGRLVFSVTRDGQSSPTESLRIANNGATFVRSNQSTFWIGSESAAGTADALITAGHTALAINNFTQSFKVFTNGNVVNTNNSYGSISDIKLKENIVDANSQWDDLKALQVRNYNFKEGQTHTQIGLVAQEVELVSPGLVTESPDRDEDGNDLGTVTKSVNYSVLYMKAVKALQEAMERIEALEAKVAALESA